MSAYSALRGVWRQLPAGLRDVVARASPLNEMRWMIARMLMRHDDLYDTDYYQSIDRDALSSARPIVASVMRDFAPRSLLDVGCGTGAILRAFAAHGVRCTGLEFSKVALKYCRERGLNVLEHDLASQGELPISRQFDVVVSLEVAEHLPRRFADRLVDLLTRHGAAVVFTAATPGQGGRDHVNEQPHDYWIAKFEKRGFAYAKNRALQWRKEWQEEGAASWYHRNLLVFTRKVIGPSNHEANGFSE